MLLEQGDGDEQGMLFPCLFFFLYKQNLTILLNDVMLSSIITMFIITSKYINVYNSKRNFAQSIMCIIKLNNNTIRTQTPPKKVS